MAFISLAYVDLPACLPACLPVCLCLASYPHWLSVIQPCHGIPLTESVLQPHDGMFDKWLHGDDSDLHVMQK